MHTARANSYIETTHTHRNRASRASSSRNLWSRRTISSLTRKLSSKQTQSRRDLYAAIKLSGKYEQ